MFLEKEDVSLYYEVQGQGQPFLLIHGVIVDGGLYEKAAELLSAYYKVITYDRRGNSRSTCKGGNVFSMESQIEDIRDLMDELSIEDTYVVGVSAGAVIGQYFLQKYPDKVRHLIMYEPAMLGEMKDEPELAHWIDMMMELINKRKLNSAVLKFVEHIGNTDPHSPKKDKDTSFREMKNHEYALTQEFPGLAAYRPDKEKMKKSAAKITLAAGEKSGNTVYVKAAGVLAEILGKKEIYYPGCHNFPYDRPEEFAACILETLNGNYPDRSVHLH